jgi:hypothetical protein
MRRMNYYGAERIGIWWYPWALGAFALRPLSVGIRFRPSRRCAGSAYIRRRDLRADLGEILGRGEIAKGLVVLWWLYRWAKASDEGLMTVDPAGRGRRITRISSSTGRARRSR